MPFKWHTGILGRWSLDPRLLMLDSGSWTLNSYSLNFVKLFLLVSAGESFCFKNSKYQVWFYLWQREPVRLCKNFVNRIVGFEKRIL